MAVIFDAQSTTDTTGNSATSFSDSANMTVGSGSNRGLVALITWGRGSSGGSQLPTAISLTWAGQALTLIPNTVLDNNNVSAVSIYGLLNPTSGTQTFAGSWTGAADFTVSLVSFTGVDQSSFATSFINGITANGGSPTAAISVTSTSLDYAVSVMGSTGFFNTLNSGTQVYKDNSPAVLGGIGLRLPGAATVSFNVDCSGNWTATGVSILSAVTAQLRAPHITKLPPFPFLPTPSQSYNAALYTVTVTLPFNQTDWSNTVRVSDWLPQPQAGINPNLFTNPFPFNQNDWAKGFDIPSVPNLLPPLNINLFTNPYPFNQYDWAKSVRIPQAPIDLSFQFNQNLTNFFPFNQTDWSKPFNVPHAPFDLSVQTNLNIFTNPIPILNVQGLITGWGVADLPVPQQPYNQALYTVTVTGTPFNQTYWPPAVRIPNAPVDFFNLTPYVTIVLPFNQIDWSKPFMVPRAAPDQTISLNPNIFTNPIPVLNINASRLVRLAGLSQVDAPYNQSLYTVTVVITTLRGPLIMRPYPIRSAPFDTRQPSNPNIFTNPYPIQNINSAIVPPRRATVFFDQTYNQALYTVTVTGTPFNQTYWPSPVKVASAPVDFFNLTPYVTIVLPFNQIDWSRPFTGLRAPLSNPPLNINLFTNPIPIFNYDGSVSVRFKGFVDTSQPYNVNLYGVVTVQVPFNQVDWSRPFVARPAPTRDEALNINLFTNPVPFSQYDWRKPFGVPHAPFDLSVQINLNLFTNPFPFNQYQYPTQRPVILGPPHVPPYNQNLYTATIGTTSHIVKFIGNVGHFMIR